MPMKKLIADLDVQIEELKTTIETLSRIGSTREELAKFLTELARRKAERATLMWMRDEGKN